MQLIINGETKDLPGLEDNPTVASLIAALGLKMDRIAIEHNGEIAARTEWESTRVAGGDRFEIVHFVGGGACS